MPQRIIDNPVINSPFVEPRRHFRFDDEGITNEIADERRPSSYFVPIPPRKSKEKQAALPGDWRGDRAKPNDLVNDIRLRVAVWRKGGYREGITSTTRRLLEYWQRADRDKRLFFCQIEAAETAIYLTEVAPRFGDAWIAEKVRDQVKDSNSELPRVALKMATGSGKTVVMAMLIAWQVLNKRTNPQDARFVDTFLIVTPGITIKDRLRVLVPTDPAGNYFKDWDLVPPELMSELNTAQVLVTNFHAFKPRERGGTKLGRLVSGQEQSGVSKETPDQMVRRVCRVLGAKKNILVINDEAHHCYRRKADGEAERLTGDDKREADRRDEEARLWINGLEAVHRKIGIKTVYDLSATPFFLRGSGYSEGTLFGWVVSDFSLIDAIEAGIVKVPRVPVSDDQMLPGLVTYRDLWLRVKDQLPRKGRKLEDLGEPKLPVELEGALQTLYDNYEKQYQKWAARGDGGPPPVFIVVCNNTSVSKIVYDYIAGWDKLVSDDEVVAVPGRLALFSNVDGDRWLHRPNTILIDSEQLDSGEALSPDFKKAVAHQIEEFKSQYKERFPGRSVDDISDADILREVMNTVGKQGRLGEQIKCVVSVSMLTEGWDANTVTHILGVRAFTTQLLCEQVIGRGLRRLDYTPDADGMFPAQYAEVYGVPFSFIPCSGPATDPMPSVPPTRVRALEDRIKCEITFPRLMGYRYELPEDCLTAHFTDDSLMALSTADVPTKVQVHPIVGEKVEHSLDALKNERMQSVEFYIAKLVLEKYFRDGDDNLKPWLFPDILRITRRWAQECVTCKSGTFPQMLLLTEWAANAAGKVYKAIVQATRGEKRLKPLLFPYDTVGSTRYVDFDTRRAVYPTRADRCHITHVVADTASWEQKLAQTLEDLPEVECYVKNQGLGFTIPYTHNGDEKNYTPDFIVRLRPILVTAGVSPVPSNGSLNLILEVSGKPEPEKASKVATARTLWVPAVNNLGEFGRWAFLEVTDPWDAENTIRAFLKAEAH